MKRIPTLLMALSAALAIGLGASVESVKDWAVFQIERAVPVAHSVEYFDPQAGHSVRLDHAPVRFDGRTALISHGEKTLRIGVDGALLTCLDPALRARNRQRAGLLAGVLLLLWGLSAGALFVLGLLGMSMALRHEARSRAKMRAPSRRRPSGGRVLPFPQHAA